MSRPSTLATVIGALVLGLLSLAPPAYGSDGASPGTLTITEYPVPSVHGPGPIAADSGGFIWFALPTDNAIGRINTAGMVAEYPVPSPFEDPRGITAGPSGTVWFTETGAHFGAEGIGRIEPSGTITEFALPANTRAFGITMGPDGNMWFTKTSYPWQIGRISPSGTVTLFPTILQNRPLNIVAGPDGNLWFTEDGIVEGGRGAIGSITTSGVITEYLLPAPPAGFSNGAQDITVGPDGALWFTWNEQVATELGPFTIRIGRITTSGTITSFPVSTTATIRAFGITTGADGNVWFTEPWANSIGRMSTSGALAEFSLPTANSVPFDITAGKGPTLWFSEPGTSAVGRIRLQPPT